MKNRALGFYFKKRKYTYRDTYAHADMQLQHTRSLARTHSRVRTHACSPDKQCFNLVRKDMCAHVGLLHKRCLYRTPPPHVRLHDVISDQDDQAPVT